MKRPRIYSLSLVSGLLAESCLGQGGVDRAIRFEITANEVNVIDRQGSQLPYPRDLLFEDLAQLTQPVLGDPLLDTADRQMGGIRAGLGFEPNPLLQSVTQIALKSDEVVGISG